jgi:hypothetical protein
MDKSTPHKLNRERPPIRILPETPITVTDFRDLSESPSILKYATTFSEVLTNDPTR